MLRMTVSHYAVREAKTLSEDSDYSPTMSGYVLQGFHLTDRAVFQSGATLFGFHESELAIANSLDILPSDLIAQKARAHSSSEKKTDSLLKRKA